MNANESELVRRLSDCARVAWESGNPISGSTPDRWQHLARAAIRRWRSFERRHKNGSPTITARTEDLARGLSDTFENQPKLTGPLIEDYRHLAELMGQVLDKES